MIYPWTEPARQEFLQRLASGRMAHAVLLCGPRDLGKTELAGQLVKALLCLDEKPGACGSCRSCRLMVGGAHPDFRLLTFEINPKNDTLRTEIVIEQVRQLNASLQLTNTLSRLKAALIFPAEAMNRNAANALLKSLEEPPGNTVLVLVSHDPARLPATIRSRCQSLHVRLPEESVAIDWLIRDGGYQPDMARAALRASAGSPLQAKRMLQAGETEQFCALDQMLNRMETGQTAIDDVVEACSNLELQGLWSWLSLIAAQRLRDSLARAEAGSDRIARLQSQADRNRKALATQLRKDLLLRDWLIQWSRLAHE